jgi:hypothetical protein
MKINTPVKFNEIPKIINLLTATGRLTKIFCGTKDEVDDNDVPYGPCIVYIAESNKIISDNGSLFKSTTAALNYIIRVIYGFFVYPTFAGYEVMYELRHTLLNEKDKQKITEQEWSNHREIFYTIITRDRCKEFVDKLFEDGVLILKKL